MIYQCKLIDKKGFFRHVETNDFYFSLFWVTPYQRVTYEHHLEVCDKLQFDFRFRENNIYIYQEV